MDIIMVRHGETEDNIKKIYSRDETRLTERGISQASKVRKLLTGYNYEKIYYSPLERTVQTISCLGLNGKEDIRIRELDFGIFEGRTFDEIFNLYPEETKLWMNDIYNYRIPRGESLMNGYKRVVEFLEELCKENKNSVLIAHDAVIRLALCWVLDSPDYFFKFKVDNGSITTISVDYGNKYIKELNYY